MRIPQPRVALEVEWREITEFPRYSVSTTGLVRNDETGRVLTRLVNRQGITYVGITKGGSQRNRSVPRLVAEAFLPLPRYKTFDTPINLDGDRLNNHVDNLMWRPRWFAMRYHRQFQTIHENYVWPIEEVATGEIFESPWGAVVKYGLLCHEIVTNASNNTYHANLDRGVWPTGQNFRHLVENTYYTAQQSQPIIEGERLSL